MIEIKPAIIPKNVNHLEESADLVNTLVKTMHVDMCDGEYVKNKSWPFKNEKEWEELISFGDTGRGLPHWEDLDYEIDLMVNDPLSIMENWIKAGASSFIIHAEGLEEDIFNKLLETADLGETLCFISFNPSTDLSQYEHWIKKADGVQLMGIEHIGFQGESFDFKVLDQIKKVKELKPDAIVQVDGAVSDQTKDKLIEAGANVLVAGSFIFNNSDPHSALEALR